MTTAAVKLDLDRILAGGQLPALPQSAISLLQLSKDPNNGPAEYAVPIESDAGLTGQVLKFVNSSYFGFSREISSVKTAITLVGVRTIKNFALWSAVFSLMPNPKCGPFDLKHLWQDSLRRALFARTVARLLGLREAEDAFAAALLQDMAVPLLAKELPNEYIKLLEARGQGSRLSELERQTFGWTHAEVGGQMARKWKLPEETAHLVERHTEIEAIVAEERANPAEAAVALSSMLPTAGDQHWPECGVFQKHYDHLSPKDSQSAAELLAQVDKEFSDFAPVLKIASPARTLLECFNEAQAAGLAAGSRTALAS
jgi:HD-like signal output (HDOD) protein